MTSISSNFVSGKHARRLRGPSVGIIALGVLALSCGAPGVSDAPEESIAETQQALGPLCMQPIIDTSNCCPFTLPNSLDPNRPDVYSGAPDADFYRNVRAKMPLNAPHGSPFSESEVRISHGWYRTGNHAAGHGAIDYEKTGGGDPSFPVRALAKGRVITVTYNNDLAGGCCGMGNTVIIEYEAPTGDRYRSIYGHLRNGAANDCQEARTFAATLDATDPYRRYVDRTCAPGTTPDPLLWGTATTTLNVVPGQEVEAGQVIGMSGNTGRGGIIGALDGNGNFNPGVTNANVHLHMYFMVYTPEFQPTTGSFWSNTDPYGAYAAVDGDNGANCYVLGANVGTHRLFAPFNPTFAGVRTDILAQYADHYPSMGYFPQTLSVYPAGSVGQRHAAGSFQPEVRSPETTARTDRSRTDFLNDLSQQAAAGLQLREIQVASFSGDIRYSGIWTRSTSSVSNTVIDADDLTWNATLTGEIANNRRHLTDQFTYTMNGIRRHAGIFATDGVSIGAFNFGWNRTLTNFNTLVANEAAVGRKPTSVSAEPPADGTFGGVFHAAQGDWFVEPNITGGPNGFLARHDFHVSQGRRLYRVQGSSAGVRFAAIWVGGERPPSAIIATSGSTNCAGASGASITLDARNSIFDAAFPLGYEWQGPFGVRTGAVQTVNLPVGSNFVMLRAWDGRGLDSITSGQIDITRDVTRPTITAPPNITITTCTGANIGMATATDACPVTITNNAPTTFPLGQRTVTWTATDQAGNTRTATQIVTAVLGDSPTCCPAGSTPRMGTSSSESITGTSGSDCILGLGGNDTINGGGGNDYISGGGGNDNISGGSGTDTCFGNSGFDTLTCESATQ